MCIKLLLGNLNPGSCSPHPTSTYTCEVTTAPRIHGGFLSELNTSEAVIIFIFIFFEAKRRECRDVCLVPFI